MRYVVIALALINGLWMLIDGIYVIANGKYIGPEKPGPWASLLSLTGVDVFKLGPLFIAFGVAWLLFAGTFALNVSWSRTFGTLLSIATFWYLPFGTLISLVIVALFVFVVKG